MGAAGTRARGAAGWLPQVLPGGGTACGSHSVCLCAFADYKPLFSPFFFVPERMAMAPRQEMLMGVIACPGLELGTRQGTVRGSMAREPGQGLAGHPQSLTDTRMGVHPAPQFCTAGQTTGNASSLGHCWPQDPLWRPGSSQGSGLTPCHSSAPSPLAPPHHEANFNYLLQAI